LETIQRWLAEKTFESPDCRSNQIEIGGPDLSMLLQRDEQEITNPLQVTLHSDQYPAIPALFSMPANDGSVTVPGSIKKIAGTSFYHSYLTSPSLIADIIDFYDWRMNSQLYRVFIIQNHKSSQAIRISFPESVTVTELRNKVFQTGNFYWSTQSDLQFGSGQNELVLKTHSDSTQTAVLTISISLSAETASGDAGMPIYKLLKSLTATADQQHIKNYYSSNDRAVQREIDKWWTLQKAVNPDWNTSQPILRNPLRYQLALTWVVEIALFLNNWKLLQEIYQTLQRKIGTVKKSSRLLFIYSRLNRLSGTESAEHSLPLAEFDLDDPFRDCPENSGLTGTPAGKLTEEQILYRSYFSGGADKDITIAAVQRCWNRLALPLFESKLERELKSNPEKIIILYLLSLYHDFPFAKLIAVKIEEKVTDPLLRLFVLLQQQIQKRFETDSVFSFKDGPQQNYTGKTLNLFDQSSLHLSRFGKRFYVQYIAADKFSFRIDKKIHCFVNSRQRQIRVYPNVPFYPQQEVSTDKRTEVLSSGYSVSWPWLWPKAEVQCSSLRFRWIFKKRRYQITIQKKKSTADLKLDGRVIDWPAHQKIIQYNEVENTVPEMLIKVWDRQGREIHLRPRQADRHIQIAGWSKNRHNQFIDQINFNYGRRQHTLSGSGQNGIQSYLNIPATVQTVNFSTKNLKQGIELTYFADPFWEKLCYYSAITGYGSLAVLIDDVLKGQFSYIQDFFIDYFDFHPKYFFTVQDKLPIDCSLLIHISAVAEGVTVRCDKKVMMGPYLIVGVKQGIEQLKRFSDTVEQQLSKDNTLSTK
jgi:hypothetical protein